MKNFLLLCALLTGALLLTAQTYDSPTGRSHEVLLTVTDTGAHGASTVFTAPTTSVYIVHWSLRTTTIAATAGTLTALTFAWNNGNAMSRNAMLVGPQVLDLNSLTSTGLTSAEISGTQTMRVVSGTAVTWATTVGVAIVGSPQYTAEFRVFADN